MTNSRYLAAAGLSRPPAVEDGSFSRKPKSSDSMAVPKRKHSNARTGTRRAHDGLKPRQLLYCAQCSTAVPAHVVCPNCGHYMGRKVVETAEKKKKKS